MTIRLSAARAAEMADRLLGAAAPRRALAHRLGGLSGFLHARPGSEDVFPLLEMARAVYPEHADPIGAFREFRRSVARFAAGQGIELGIGVDGHKQLDPSLRTCWLTGSDDERLTEISAAATAPEAGIPPVPAYGRPERDGKPLV
ncbi:MAG: hypothetical protein ACRDJF_12355, partial [Actinomycetota bacterium]